MSSVMSDEKVEQEARIPTLAERAAEAVISEVIASADELPFDRVSRQRLLVAQSAADTIEQLAESGAWERLEPSIAEHLLIQARRLGGYVTTLTEARPVRASDPALLLLRRLERRLAIAVELVEDEAAKTEGMVAGGLFLGDFTETPAPEGDRVRPKQGKEKAARSEAAKSAVAPRKWTTKAQRLAEMRQTRRVMTYIGVMVVAVMGSLAYRAVTAAQERPVRNVPPPVIFTPNEYLKDAQGFLPATSTAHQGNDLSVIVSQEWLLRTYERRATDANGLATYLLNRNVRRVSLQWEDGRPIVQFENGAPTWFDVKITDTAGPATITPFQ